MSEVQAMAEGGLARPGWGKQAEPSTCLPAVENARLLWTKDGKNPGLPLEALES